jgi:hypothetical protein
VLVGIILIAAGIAACFYGGYLITYVYFSLHALFFFLFFALVLSSFGIFSILETHNETTVMGVFKAIIGFVVCTVVSFIVGAFLYQK